MDQTEFKVLISKVFYIDIELIILEFVTNTQSDFLKKNIIFCITYFNIKSSFPSKVINNYSGYKKSNNSSDLNMTIYIIKIKLIFFHTVFTVDLYLKKT